MRASAPLSLRQVLRFVPRTCPALVEIVSRKRPEIIVRRSRYVGITVDEGVLTQTFPWVARTPTLQVFLLLEGSMHIASRDGVSAFSLRPGDTVLLSPTDASLARYENVSVLDLEWRPEGVVEGPTLQRLEPLDVALGTAIGEQLVSGAASDAELFGAAFGLFRKTGAPLGGLSVDMLVGGPSEQDLRIAEAITVQIADLRSAASALSLGEHAELSPRQLQRVFARFCERYRLNATSWRDMRNRYRLQIAMVLASIPSLSIATIADEVGFGSAAALARAFANAGLPSPSELREKLARARSA